MSGEFKVADVFVNFATKNYAQTMRAMERLKDKTKQASVETKSSTKAIANESSRVAESITKAFQTPIEKWRERMGVLNGLVKSGAISWGTYGRASQSALEVYKKSLPMAKAVASPGQKMSGVAGAAGNVASQAGFGGIARMLGALGGKGGIIGAVIVALIASIAAAVKVASSGIATASKYSVGWATITDRIAARWEQIKYKIGKPLVDALLPALRLFERLLSLIERLGNGTSIFSELVSTGFKTMVSLAEAALKTIESILNKMGLLSPERPAGMGSPATYGSLEQFSKTAQANVTVDPGLDVAKKQLFVQEQIKGFLEGLKGAAKAAINPFGIGP